MRFCFSELKRFCFVVLYAFFVATIIGTIATERAGILLLDEQCEGSISHYPTALTNLGLSYTVAINDTEFYNQLTSGNSWDLVLVDEYYDYLDTSIPVLESYIAGGGKCVFSYWYSSGWNPGVWEASYVSSFNTPLDTYRWNTSHELFTTPNNVPDLTWSGDSCNTDGHKFNVTGGGIAVAGYTPSQTTDEGAIIIGNNGRTILLGPIPGLFGNDDDTDGIPDMVEFLENAISFVYYGSLPTPTPTPSGTQTPECIHHGDVNLSGDLTAGDAQTAFYIVLGLVTPTYEEWCAADCNDSGDVTAGDAQQIFLAVLGSGNCVDPI